MLEVKFKKLVPEAKIPAYAKPGDAGLDLTATSKNWSDDFQCWIYGTGLAVEIPEGYVGLIFPRSSIRKYCLALTNCVGVIDSGYRGEIMCTFRPQDLEGLARLHGASFFSVHRITSRMACSSPCRG